jgi:hypothetical protein
MGCYRNKTAIASHVIPLVYAFDHSEGAVLEIGTGYYSTTLLKWLCQSFNRTLLSVDNSPHWIERAKRTRVELQEIELVEDWTKFDATYRHWGLVFIDHGPKEQRHIDILKLKDHADFIVIHDSEPDVEDLYQYEKVYPYFKYRYDYNKIKPHTTILSNTKQLWI